MIREKAEKFMVSGCVDMSAYETNIMLPKIFMTAACKDMVQEWRPLNKEARATAKNAEHFI